MADATKEPHRSNTYRIGIDVGGTFTKAVLIDNATHRVVGRYSVLTTHSDPRGVAAGVVEVFRNVLERSAVDPDDVVFLAHSTTQATDALSEEAARAAVDGLRAEGARVIVASCAFGVDDESGEELVMRAARAAGL